MWLLTEIRNGRPKAHTSRAASFEERLGDLVNEALTDKSQRSWVATEGLRPDLLALAIRRRPHRLCASGTRHIAEMPGKYFPTHSKSRVVSETARRCPSMSRDRTGTHLCHRYEIGIIVSQNILRRSAPPGTHDCCVQSHTHVFLRRRAFARNPFTKIGSQISPVCNTNPPKSP